MTADYDVFNRPEDSVYDGLENRDDTYDEWAPMPTPVERTEIRDGMGDLINSVPTQPTLAELHDLMIVLHIDLQRIYDLLYVLTRPVHNQESFGDKLVERHEQGHVFAPEPAIAPEAEND